MRPAPTSLRRSPSLRLCGTLALVQSFLSGHPRPKAALRPESHTRQTKLKLRACKPCLQCTCRRLRVHTRASQSGIHIERQTINLEGDTSWGEQAGAYSDISTPELTNDNLDRYDARPIRPWEKGGLRPCHPLPAPPLEEQGHKCAHCPSTWQEAPGHESEKPSLVKRRRRPNIAGSPLELAPRRRAQPPMKIQVKIW